VNGTSGYEEAAGQGLLAGVNAARFVGGQEPLVLGRDQAYIGVMADDLTTQDFIEPYRMLTSRAEHRLLLRADNADERLARIAYDAGLISSDRLALIEERCRRAASLVSFLSSVHVTPNTATNDLLQHHDLPPVTRSMLAADYARRPDVTLGLLLHALAEIHPSLHKIDVRTDELQSIEISLRYQNYVEKELAEIERARRMEHTSIPASFDYSNIPGFRNEAREKLIAIRPATIGQASRISGVTPADIAVLLVHVRRRENRDIITRAETEQKTLSQQPVAD
jgi:tRNA uridine 5-carboxymethylaminomethyl modification enzyme